MKDRKQIVQTFSAEQLEKLLKQPDLRTFTGFRDYCLMLLLLETGVRVNELIGMELQDVRIKEGAIYKGAVKGQLHQKLNQLQQQGILPPLMGDISKVIKDFGNMAAHGDQVDFNSHMVDGMFRFTNKILEYVYVLPREMKRARQEIEMMDRGRKLKETQLIWSLSLII
ncbi:tyrosine-type recombinase/integrase [Bacillus atrophaeus]|uniref:tyrosine-type recombinase/integrase n=2 Tax=Bacillus atrophaeus TaxID=1452 RepID=UPI0022818409|nr:tyrosine-type recombinase/integrase [Bacillus atrophaeus]MCY8489348.1 tyrosine-type recombinase/integrase [Bacillus atrophaeus]MCY8819070.1 tyrosine-type recombinase/integrase [Bacillus atrophaeus]